MSDWREEDQDTWPVQYPAKGPPQESGQVLQKEKPPRWIGRARVDTSAVQKGFMWLLLAAEIGMFVVAACVLPLAFLNLPLKEEGLVGALLSQVGEWLGLSNQATCLVLGLPCLILLLTLGLNLWLFRWLRQRRGD